MLAWHRFAIVLSLRLVLRFVTVAADDPDDFGMDRYLCPSDTELVSGGQCRGRCIAPYSSTPGLQRAIDQCQPANTLPVIIKNDEQQSYWLSRIGSSSDYFPIGIVCDEATQKYKWIDGSVITFKPDIYNNDLDGNCRSDVWWNLKSNGEWSYYQNSEEAIYYFICCVADIYHPELSDDGCVDFNDDEEDSICYQISDTVENWSDSQKICRAAGSTVSSVHNEHENSYLRRLAVSRGFTNGLMLGASVGISGKSDTFGWADGSDWDYTNFLPGFPFDGFGDCLAMTTNDASAQWANMECSEKLPFVCARKPGSVPVASTTCPGPAVKAGDVITSPGYPTNATIPCDFYLKVDTGKKVQMEIILLEANTCCDNLYLYEGTVGGNLIDTVSGAVASKTYTSPTNQMKVSWQPNGGVNVRGLLFKFYAV